MYSLECVIKIAQMLRSFLFPEETKGRDYVGTRKIAYVNLSLYKKKFITMIHTSNCKYIHISKVCEAYKEKVER